MGPRVGPPSHFFVAPSRGLRAHCRRRQDILARQTAEAPGSRVAEPVASISSPQRCGEDATRRRISRGHSFYLRPRRTPFPIPIGEETRRPARRYPPRPSGVNVHLPPIFVPRSVSFAGCLRCSRATGQVYLQESRGTGFHAQVCKRPHPPPGLLRISAKSQLRW